MSTLVRDFLWSVSVTLIDASPQFRRWTEAEMVGYTTDGQRALAKYLPRVSTRIDVIRLQAGTRQSIRKIPAASVKPGDGMAPFEMEGKQLIGLVKNMGADGLTPGAVISPIERQVLDGTDRNWHAKTATAVDHLIFDPRLQTEFYVYPGVGATPVWVEAQFAISPPAIPVPSPEGIYAKGGASAAELYVGDEYLDELRAYVLARAYSKDAENPASATLAAAYGSSFLNSLNLMVQAATGNNPNLTMLPFAPEVPVTAQ